MASQDAPIETVVDPGTDRARRTLAEALETDALVTVFGRCTVDYDGRASSTLDAGDRLVVCKPDGTVLVHSDEGREPVNWQPPGCSQRVEEGADAVALHSHRESPAEELIVRFERVDQVTAYAADDPATLSLSGTEEDLREHVLASPETVEEGFTPLATERRTSAGAVDVFGEDAEGRTVVLELKRRRVGPDAVGQLSRYVQALDRDLHAESEIRGILVAPSVTDRARELLAERGLEFVSLEPPDGSAE